MIPILLTATITPNVSAYSAHRDPEKRKREYLDAISFYKTFSTVYFLENSGYPIAQDHDFPAETDTLHYHLYPKPMESGRNKGSQEFEMLDRFIADELKTDGFIKITGRYLYQNFGEVFAYIKTKSARYDLLLDAYAPKKSAFTSFFYASRQLYDDRLRGAWREMTDQSGFWAEHVFYRRLAAVKRYAFFRPLPLLKMISGSDGISVDYARTPVRNAVKNLERHALAVAGIRQLLF